MKVAGDKFLCGACRDELTYKKAIALKYCGHVFCSVCGASVLKLKSCAICSREIKSLKKEVIHLH